jgi:thiamine biosynthesis lipoprotein
MHRAMSAVTPWLLSGAAALSLGACSAPAPQEGPVYHRLAGEAFGTSWHLTWSGPEPAVVEPAVLEVLERVDARMSSWRSDSELSAIRQGPSAVVVSEETADVVRQALDLSDATGGAFDPTVEPLMELWGFRGTPRSTPPSDEEVAAARSAVGAHRVEVFRHGGLSLVDAHGTALDLSAIAKGHGVDAVHHALAALGATDQLVEIGGEVRVAGRGPRGGAWALAVEAPAPDGSPSTEGVLHVTNLGMASSGNYRSGYELDGERVVHTMDPRTGRPRRSDVLATTVLAPTTAEADGWATALMVMPYDEGLAAVEARPELEALWVRSGDEGRQVLRSSGMPAVSAPRR